MNTVKSRARKQNLGLTVSQATRDARKVVDATMPGVNATVESRFGHDLATDTPTVITTVTFPANQAGRTGLALLLVTLPGHLSRTVDSARIVVTRKR